MAVESQELQLTLRELGPFFQDDGVTARAWGDVRVPWYLGLIAWFLKLAPVPQTVGLYPDGNRRFARAKGLPDHNGHVMGGDNLEKVSANVQRCAILCLQGSDTRFIQATSLAFRKLRWSHDVLLRWQRPDPF